MKKTYKIVRRKIVKHQNKHHPPPSSNSQLSVNSNKITYWYWNRFNISNAYNLGDDYNKYFVEKLYGSNIQYNENNPTICFCGSILNMQNVKNAKYIVGCGLQNTNNTKNLPASTSYIAVRGKTTLDIIKKTKYGALNRFKSNILLCDPGLLLSRLYQPKEKIQIKHKIGIIAHYADEEKLRKMSNGQYYVISMQTNDVEAFVKEILSCEIILSSSLHGIIFAHSYGIPAYHIEVTDLQNNGNFKFADYYSSFDGLKYHKFYVKENIPIGEILKYHDEFHEIANPTMEQILEKQKQYIQILPFSHLLKDEFKNEVDAYKSKMLDNRKIIVTLTSWSKRIQNCIQVIKHVFDNTLQPDALYLNLSTEEFPNKEEDLPTDLVQYSMDNPKFHINWIDGPNTKTMKKVFPVLQFLNDDDIIIYIDDDVLLPEGFIQSRIDDFILNKCQHPITAIPGSISRLIKDMAQINLNSSQPTSLITKKMLFGYEIFYNNVDVYTRGADDSLYMILCALNGYTYIPCSDYMLNHDCIHQINNNYNCVSPFQKSGVFKKLGYCAQNTYITLLLYCSILKQNQHVWKSVLSNKLSKFKHILKYENNKEFQNQIMNFKTLGN